MGISDRVVCRVAGLFVRWGVIDHPYGREYAEEHYTISGRHVPAEGSQREAPRVSARMGPRTSAALMVVGLLLLSFFAAGVLVASG